MIVDARYALGQLAPVADGRYVGRKASDSAQRAIDALERIVGQLDITLHPAEALLEPETAARHDGAAVAG